MSTSLARVLAAAGAALVALVIVFGAPANGAVRPLDDPTPPPTSTSATPDGGNPGHG